MEDEVLDFIERRWRGTDARWNSGNCYWFALILIKRFPYLKMYYLPIQGHFIAGDGKKFYDIGGEVHSSKDLISLDFIYMNDPNWYYRLMRDCRD